MSKTLCIALSSLHFLWEHFLVTKHKKWSWILETNFIFQIMISVLNLIWEFLESFYIKSFKPDRAAKETFIFYWDLIIFNFFVSKSGNKVITKINQIESRFPPPVEFVFTVPHPLKVNSSFRPES